MGNINQAYRKPFRDTFLLCFFLLGIFGGGSLLQMLLFQPVRDKALIPVAIIGAVLILLGCSMWWIPRGNLRETRVTAVLTDESMKYSRRLMVPFRWRLEIPRIPSAINGDGDATIKHVCNIIWESHTLLNHQEKMFWIKNNIKFDWNRWL
jgi:hypothetical protein